MPRKKHKTFLSRTEIKQLEVEFRLPRLKGKHAYRARCIRFKLWKVLHLWDQETIDRIGSETSPMWFVKLDGMTDLKLRNEK